MATATSDVREMVVRVIETCLGGARGFDAAADAVKDTTQKRELALLGRQRRAFTSQLQILLGTFGDTPAEDAALTATISGAMNNNINGNAEQGWMSPDSSFNDSPENVLTACERGELAAMEAYRLVLEEPLPEVTRQIIASQFKDMVRSQSRIKALCETARQV